MKELQTIEKSRQDLEPYLQTLALHLEKPMPRKELFKILKNEHFCSDKTIDRKLKEIINNNIPIISQSGEKFTLKKEAKGSEISYSLEQVCPF